MRMNGFSLHDLAIGDTEPEFSRAQGGESGRIDPRNFPGHDDRILAGRFAPPPGIVFNQQGGSDDSMLSHLPLFDFPFAHEEFDLLGRIRTNVCQVDLVREQRDQARGMVSAAQD